MRIEPEVSQIDTTHAVSVANGISVPALIVRRASTTVELRDGQSFVIGGLLQTTDQNQIDQLPWLGSVPVLGALFSSKSYQKNETDLAIIVTPHLVRPTRPGDVIATPADDTLPPNDVDFFLLSKTEVTRAEARALTPASRPHRRRRRGAVHRPHARYAQGGFQCGRFNNAAREPGRAVAWRPARRLRRQRGYLDRRDDASRFPAATPCRRTWRRRWSIRGRARARTAPSRTTARGCRARSSVIAPTRSRRR